MFLENNYIYYSNNLNINSISSYKFLMTKFINKFILHYKNTYNNKIELYNDAIIYSKYYLYYKSFNCIYDNNIMEIIYNIEYL